MKREQLRSLRNFAGLPPLTVEEEAAHEAEEFSFGDASAQDESGGRQSWYLEMFHGEEGHYSVVLYSDGKCEIVAGSGPNISVNSSLGRKIIAAARKELGVGETFTIEAQSDTSASQVDKPDLHYPKLEELVHKTLVLWKKYPEGELQEFVKQQLRDAFSLGYTTGYNSRTN